MLRLVFTSRLRTPKRIRSRQCRHYSDSTASSNYSEGSQARRFRPSTSQSTPGAPAPTERTFVSSHYKVDEEQVERYLARRNIMVQHYGNSLKLQCPFCPPDRNRSGFRLVISKENGHFNCSACNTQGSWFDFQKKIQSTSSDSTRPQATTDPRKVAALTGMSRAAQSMRSNANATAVAESHSKALPEQDKLSKHIENLKKLPSVSEYLTQEKKLDQSTLDKYRVGGCVLRIAETINRGPQAGEKRTTDHYCVSFPWIDTTKAGKEVLVRMKTRSIDPKSSLVRLDPQVGRASFFGWHLISKEAKVIIVTEDEFDAMAVFQATGEPAVALASGASYQLPIELVDKLDKFDQIYLWMHDNVGSQEVAKKWADKLGRERVYLVPSKLGANRDSEAEDAVSAWEAFSKGSDLTELIKSSKPLPHQEIVTFKDLREEVYRELAHPEQVAGVPSITFPSLNKILRGHRRGELTVFTGPTGIGKTTILAQMSLDYLRQGVSTLWGSFEINNVRLAKKMITQFAEKSLEGEESLDTYESVADKFSSLPLHFMRFHGNTGLDAVFDAMEYAVYVYDVEHIVLDNLQFMTPTHLVKGFDKFDQLDMSIARLRKFATSKNIHITIIIHPRKEDDGATLSTSSVFGTAKATQEADNVVILQKGKHYRYIEVTKNRFSGDLGRVPFRFDPETLKFSELTQEEVTALDHGKPYVPKPPTDPSEGNDDSVIPPPPPSLTDETVLEHATSAAPTRKGKKKAPKAAAAEVAEAAASSTEAAPAVEPEQVASSEEVAEKRTSEAMSRVSETGEDNFGIDPSQLESMESKDTSVSNAASEDDERQRVREKLEQANLADKVVEAGEAASNAAKI